MPVLVALTALLPLGMHMLLPALPSIAREFGAPIHTIQWAVTGFMIAVAVAQLVYGPLSDRYGRRAPLLVGLLIFAAGSLVCAAAPNTWVLLLGRVIQGAGACTGIVLGRAMVRDVYSTERSSTLLAYVSMALMMVPGMAPIIGGVLLSWLGWRWPFLLNACIGVALFAIAWRLRETHLVRLKMPSLLALVRDFGLLMRKPAFVFPALATSFPSAGFFGFVSIAPALLDDRLQVPPDRYGFYFFMLPLGYFIGSFLATRLTPRLGGAVMALAGFTLAALFSLGMVAMVLTTELSALKVFLAVGLINGSMGLSVPTLQVRAMSADPRLIGAASGLLGFLQMAFGALGTQVLGALYDATALPPAAVLLTTTVLAVTMVVLGRERRAG